MEAKELRIGNYVEIFGIQKIISINSKKIKVESEKINGSVSSEKVPLNSASLEPIPLTEEWLLNFGFEIGENKKWENWNFGLKIYKDGDYFEIDQLPVFIFLKYVHQLQNLYFALTGEELKIEPKTI